MQSDPTETNFIIETIQLKKAAVILRAINHPLRQQIMYLLHKHDEMMVTELYLTLRLEQSVASQHLAILRTAGFVKTRRDGKKVFYSVNYSRLDYVTNQAKALNNSN